MRIVNCGRFPQSLTDLVTTIALLDALIRSAEELMMSACTRCGVEQTQYLSETTGHAQLGEPGKFVHACGQCGAAGQLMALSEAAKANTLDAMAQARLSSIWVLTILVITCVLSLLSLYHPGAKQGPILVFSKLANQVLTPPAN
jgi:hypothetical protein